MVPIERLLHGAAAHRQETGRPLVTLSYAQSLDGSLTDRRGAPLRLSGDASMHLTHHLRAVHDALMVGVGTLLADDPQLTVRLVDGPQPQPVILDSRLRTPPGARVFQGPRPPLIAACLGAGQQARTALEAQGAEILECPPNRDGRVSLDDLLTQLASRGIDTLMVEGGAAVITSFLAQRLADHLVLTIAPLFVGGLHAPESPVAVPAGDGPRWPTITGIGTEKLDEDIILWGKILYDR